MVRALLEFAAWPEVVTGVDEPNTGSIRVVEKLGFERTGEGPGAFGRVFMYRWRP